MESRSSEAQELTSEMKRWTMTAEYGSSRTEKNAACRRNEDAGYRYGVAAAIDGQIQTYAQQRGHAAPAGHRDGV